jgi:hypothetical protein
MPSLILPTIDAEKRPKRLATLLLGDTDGPAATTSGLGVLTADTEAPVVTETTVGADLLQALEIVTELGVDTVGENLAVLAIDNIALPVEEPAGNLVLGGVLDDGDDTLELFGRKLTGAVKRMSAFLSFLGSFNPVPRVPNIQIQLSGSFRQPSQSNPGKVCLRAANRGEEGTVPLVEIDIGLLADQVGVPATDTLDLGQGVHDLLLAVNIGVEQTQDELEVALLPAN